MKNEMMPTPSTQQCHCSRNSLPGLALRRVGTPGWRPNPHQSETTITRARARSQGMATGTSHFHSAKQALTPNIHHLLRRARRSLSPQLALSQRCPLLALSTAARCKTSHIVPTTTAFHFHFHFATPSLIVASSFPFVYNSHPEPCCGCTTLNRLEPATITTTTEQPSHSPPETGKQPARAFSGRARSTAPTSRPSLQAEAWTPAPAQQHR